MAKKIDPRILLVGAIVIGIVILLASGILPFGAQTVISQGEISYNDNTQTYAVTAVVTSSDNLITIPTSSLNKPGQVESDKRLDIFLSNDRVWCEYNLTPRTDGLITWFEVGSPLRRVDYSLQMSEAIGDDISTLRDFPVIQRTIGFGSGDPASFTANDVITDFDGQGQMRINQIGQLPQGLNCPEASNAAIVELGDGTKKLVARDELQFLVNGNPICFGVWPLQFCFDNPLNLLEFLATNDLPPPPTWDQAEDFFVRGSTGNLEADLPTGSTSAVVQLEFDREFVEGVTVVIRAGQPDITNFSPNRIELETGQTTNLSVAVRNSSGSADTFIVTPQQQAGYNVSPVSVQTNNLSVGSSDTVNFTITATAPVDTLMTVTANSLGTGGSDTVNIPVDISSGAGGGFCGDGICSILDLETQLNCPLDCGEAPECVTNANCAEGRVCSEGTCVIPPSQCPPGTQLVITDTPVFLIDLGIIQLIQIGVTTETACVSEGIDFITIGLIIAVIILAVVVFTRMKKK